ncbi:hypothetical protein EDM80_02165 [bacterium]|nr:MAG: hypothetical protein EDM80_02165 [bacterium]RIK62348.1 MAG: hypothetical protein DCC64_10500 [Planctomycetota bacterium]
MSRLLVLALHGSPGDPERAQSDFGFLQSSGRSLEFLLLSDRNATAREQLLALAARYYGAEISVAPLLLGAGYHYQHDLLPALSALPGSRLLPLFGRSEAFARALTRALCPIEAGQPLHWLVPGGPAVAEDLCAVLSQAHPVLAAQSQWHLLPRAELPSVLREAHQGHALLAVLREGRIAQSLSSQWPGPRPLRLLLDLASLQEAVQQWIEAESGAGLIAVESRPS